MEEITYHIPPAPTMSYSIKASQSGASTRICTPCNTRRSTCISLVHNYGQTLRKRSAGALIGPVTMFPMALKTFPILPALMSDHHLIPGPSLPVVPRIHHRKSHRAREKKKWSGIMRATSQRVEKEIHETKGRTSASVSTEKRQSDRWLLTIWPNT